MRLETEKEVMISKQVEACGYSKQIGAYAIAAVVNALQAEGAEEFGLGVRVALPAFGFMALKNISMQSAGREDMNCWSWKGKSTRRFVFRR